MNSQAGRPERFGRPARWATSVRRRHHRFASACSALALFAAASGAWAAEGQQAPPEGRETSPAQPYDFEITVFGQRAPSLLEGLETDQVYDPDRIASYAVSTVGELLEELAEENGDEAPAILVNGRPITSRSDISDFPAEAIARIETLPRGAAARVGGAGGQRVYNVVLKSSVRSVTVTGSRLLATEGGFGIWRGEALGTLIRGQDRVNLAVRHADSDELLERDRDLVPFADPTPFAAAGNVLGVSGGEIDPALSLLAGRPVLRAGVPATTAGLTLGDFAQTADSTNPSLVQNFRALRSAARRTEASLAANKQIAPGFSASLNARFGTSNERGRFGLPRARFLIGPDNQFTPFTNSVIVAVNDPSRPLINRSRVNDFSMTAGLVADVLKWQVTTTATFAKQSRRFAYDQAVPFGVIPLSAEVDPFSGNLGPSIPVETLLIRNPSSRREATVDVAGPLFALPAGTVLARVGATFASSELTPRSALATGGGASFRRPERVSRANLILPLTRTDKFLGGIGESDLTLEAAMTDLGRFGTLNYRAATLNWQPFDWLRLSALKRHAERAPEPDSIAGAVTVTQDVRYFDPVRNETVSLTTISGGFPGLANETQKTTRISADAAVLKRPDLRFTAEYLATRFEDQIGSTPPPNAAVLAAFPDRFVRDPSGRLISVDTRPINFDRQQTRQLRVGTTGSIPLYRDAGPGEAGASAGPRPTIQFSGSHTVIFSNTVLIRSGLEVIDLLAGGASGVGTSPQRHTSDASIALTDRGSGIRLSVARRGRSLLQIGSGASFDRLEFSPVTKVDVRAYLDTEQAFPAFGLARKGRILLAIDNLTNRRQLIRDSSGNTPFGFQSVFRDPLGRTVTLELRKAF